MLGYELGLARLNSGPGQLQTDRTHVRLRPGIGERAPRRVFAGSITADSPSLMCGPSFTPPPLSFSYKRETSAEASPFTVSFPNAEVRHHPPLTTN
jgi:hypothetical protein